MKQISFFVLGSVIALASAPAPAQDFTAGKTPAQLFNSDCAECHRSPNGLARNRDVRMLAGFLREHYTTKSDTAGSLAAYVSGFAGGGAADARNRGGTVAAPVNAATGERPQGDRRNRRDGEATATGEDARTTAKPIEDLVGRRRRTTNLSGDGEKRRLRHDGDVQRPPGGIAATPAPVQSAAPAESSAPRDATDPISRLRSYLSSGLGLESTVAEAAKMGPPKSRKRRGGKEAAESTPPDAQATAKSAADAPPAALPSSTMDVTSTAPPPEGGAPPTSVPAAPAAVTPPRLGQ